MMTYDAGYDDAKDHYDEGLEQLRQLWGNLLLDLATYNLEALMFDKWELEEVVFRIATLDSHFGITKHGRRYREFLIKKGYTPERIDTFSEF